MKPYYKVVASDSFRKFDTIEEAQSVAEGQAADHPGQSFEILRCVGIAQTSKASTFWMDGEEPPEKPRWRYFHDRPKISGLYALYCRERDGVREWASAHAPEWERIDQSLDSSACEIESNKLPVGITP